jgi:GNAT superfamily N-acetyltransferase
MITVVTLQHETLHRDLFALAQLRIQVFREWPYLYEGTLDYESDYLDRFSKTEGSVLVVARDGDSIVGAATACPLLGHASEFAVPFENAGMNPNRIFYFGESVLLPQYRGKGIGHAFFDHREAAARESGDFSMTTFCAVVRPETDQRRTANHRSLETFWQKRGYEKIPGMVTEFSWNEPGIPTKVSHTMQFWKRDL